MPLSIPNCIHSNRLNVLAQTLRNFTDDCNENIRMLLQVGVELTGADALVYKTINGNDVTTKEIKCLDEKCPKDGILSKISYKELKKELHVLPANRDDNQLCYFYSSTLKGMSKKLTKIFDELGIFYFFMCVSTEGDVDSIVSAVYRKKVLTTLADMDTISFISSIIKTQELNKNINNQLKHQLKFMELLAHLSNDFSRLSNEKMKEAINNAIAKLGMFLNIDRSYLFQINIKKNIFEKKFEWANDGIKSWSEDVLEKDQFEWIMQHINGNKIISYRNIEESDLPQSIKNYLHERNVKTILLIPIISNYNNNVCIGGFYGFSCENKREFWTQEMKRQLQIVSFMLATALKRLEIYEKTKTVENDLKETLDLWKKEREQYDFANEKREKLLKDSLKALQTLASSSNGDKNEKS